MIEPTAQPSKSSGEQRPEEAGAVGTPSIVAGDGEKNSRAELFATYPWLVYVFPLAVFMLVGAFEPTPPSPHSSTVGWSLPYSAYPVVYTLKIVLTLAAMAFVWPGYRQFPWRLSAWSFLVGALGVVVWIGLSKLQLENRLFASLGLDWLKSSGQRSAFNPLEQLADRPALAYAFLAMRFFGLVVVVAVIEEFFLRGFLMRFFALPDWWNVPIGQVNRTAVAVGTAVPMVMHPAELLAAAAWFSLVTLLMIKTRNIWDCVVAHGLTNLLLGLYVLYSGEWQFL